MDTVTDNYKLQDDGTELVRKQHTSSASINGFFVQFSGSL